MNVLKIYIFSQNQMTKTHPFNGKVHLNSLLFFHGFRIHLLTVKAHILHLTSKLLKQSIAHTSVSNSLHLSMKTTLPACVWKIEQSKSAFDISVLFVAKESLNSAHLCCNLRAKFLQKPLNMLAEVFWRWHVLFLFVNFWQHLKLITHLLSGGQESFEFIDYTKLRYKVLQSKCFHFWVRKLNLGSWDLDLRQFRECFNY